MKPLFKVNLTVLSSVHTTVSLLYQKSELVEKFSHYTKFFFYIQDSHLANFYQQCEKLTTSISTRKYLETYTFSANKRRAPILNLINGSGVTQHNQESTSIQTPFGGEQQQSERKESVSSSCTNGTVSKPSGDLAKLIIIDNNKEILKNSVKVSCFFLNRLKYII